MGCHPTERRSATPGTQDISFYYTTISNATVAELKVERRVPPAVADHGATAS